MKHIVAVHLVYVVRASGISERVCVRVCVGQRGCFVKENFG